jgi:hypothetical protein
MRNRVIDVLRVNDELPPMPHSRLTLLRRGSLVPCGKGLPLDPAALMLHVITRIIPAMITGKKTVKMTVLPMSDTFLSFSM